MSQSYRLTFQRANITPNPDLNGCSFDYADLRVCIGYEATEGFMFKIDDGKARYYGSQRERDLALEAMLQIYEELHERFGLDLEGVKRPDGFHKYARFKRWRIASDVTLALRKAFDEGRKGIAFDNRTKTNQLRLPHGFWVRSGGEAQLVLYHQLRPVIQKQIGYLRTHTDMWVLDSRFRRVVVDMLHDFKMGDGSKSSPSEDGDPFGEWRKKAVEVKTCRRCPTPVIAPVDYCLECSACVEKELQVALDLELEKGY
jgi:hypothetical protein